jgi:hypothetical protein
MKILILAGALAVLFPSIALAKTVMLKGHAADAFIARHFPNADIPGPVRGYFRYVDSRHHHKRGYATCNVPAMGARSDGAVSTCRVRY